MEDVAACDAGAADVAGVTGRDSSGGTTNDDASLDFICPDEVVVAAAATTALVSSLEISLAAEISKFSGNCCLGAVSGAFWSSAG